ncbi:hypothetical protein R1sor_015421 [Riccia sorocarpa]|uniref:Topoisomerase II-associated protein PAT1 n=1 Tax=Riccia sorocarpa TaxID=122646 RepID=A0ABD3HF69_9MARC
MEPLQAGKREGAGEPGVFEGRPSHLVDNPSESETPVDERFDASQYAFFGKDVTQEIEIGGLDEEEDTEPIELPEEDIVDETFPETEEIEAFGSASNLEDVSELATSFMKQNRIASRSDDEAASLGNLEAGSNASGGEAPTQPFELNPPSNWLDPTNQETEAERGPRKWWPNSQQLTGSEAGGSTGSSPRQPQAQTQGQQQPPSSQQPQQQQQTTHAQQSQQQQQWWGLDPSSQASPPAGAGVIYPPQRTQQVLQGGSSGQAQLMRSPSQGHSSGGSLPGQYSRQYSGLQPPIGVMPSMTPYGAGLPPQFSSPMSPLAPPAQWLAQANVQLGSGPGSGPQQVPQHSTLMPPQVVLQYQRPHVPQLHAVPPPPFPPHLKPQHMYNVTPPAPQMLPKMGENLMTGDFRDHGQFRGRQQSQQRHHQHGMQENNFPGRNNTQSNGWQPLRSKYMTVEEIENIVRIQWAATHSSDPYVDDYYHQAVQSKVSANSPHGRRHFAPSHLRDLPSHTRAAVEPHAYLQVDALGRVPFSSIRRPRPLLEMDSAAGIGGFSGMGQSDGLVEGVPQHRPLEQEPMLAARIAIEDGLCLLLDVDDIDRVLAISQPPDGGAQLRRRRQILLEGLAASLQLADVNGMDAGGRSGNGRYMGLSAKDDLVFLRLVSLPKGRKLLTRYLQLLPPGSELVRIVAMALFRHLRFLFGGVQSDPSTSATSVGLANAAAMSVLNLDLPALSACLAAVVLAPEQPPLRPMGSPAGDGATVVLRAVLERATALLTDRNTNYPMQNRAVWQASFDAFFALLAKYCTNKYDSIFHSLMMASPGNSAAINQAAAVAMSKEMPVELLRASLPHTNDHQRKLLLEFTQRSMAMGTFSGAGSDGHANTAAVRG